jgi:hypothetical protein
MKTMKIRSHDSGDIEAWLHASLHRKHILRLTERDAFSGWGSATRHTGNKRLSVFLAVSELCRSSNESVAKELFQSVLQGQWRHQIVVQQDISIARYDLPIRVLQSNQRHA